MQWNMILHAASASHSKQASNRDFALGAAASEADLAPLHGASKRALRDVIGRLDTVMAQECEESLEVLQQRPGEIRHIFVAAVEIAVRQGEELLLQRN